MTFNQLIRKFPPQVVVVRNAIPAELLAESVTPNKKYGKYSDEDFLPLVDEFLKTYSLKYGIPVGYDREKNGSIVQNIIPDRKLQDVQISSSSAVALQMHTETAFHPYKPDWIILGCVKGDKKAKTLYATMDEILYELDESTVWELRNADFTTRVDASFRLNGEPDKIVVVRPIVGAGDWFLTYDADLMEPLTPHAKAAFSKLAKAIKKRTRSVVLEAGDVMVINNRTTVHGRNSFAARYDGSDRWLKRILLREEMPPAEFLDGEVIRFEARK